MESKRKFNIWTSGCQMNEHDTEIMRALLEQEGYLWTSDPEEADIVILNTCSVRKSAEQRALGLLGNLKHRKKRDPDLVIAVGGCMTHNPEVRELLINKIPFVDIIFGTRNYHHLPEFLREAESGRVIADDADEEIPGVLPACRTSKVKAYVTIMYGCNNFCSYCIVPYTRGREKSRPLEEVYQEVAELAEKGYQEVMLLGQNVNSYGKDLEGNINFAKLLAEIDKIDGLSRIRYTTSHPRDFTDELIETIAASQKVCEHFHLPLQAGSNKVLQLMNRGYTRERYLELTNSIRERIPEASITTDIIVGFPGETEEDFLDTLDLVERVRFDAAYTFLFSPREGTPAAEMLDQIPDEVKKDRFNRLVELQNKITLEKNLPLVNQLVEVLVEGRSKKDPERWSGRTRTNKIVNFDAPDDTDLTGKLVDVQITSAQTWNLNGKLKKVHQKEGSDPLSRN
ncbi:MAG TPA: tRNA (N6-isopentenyl adenosine(37)-C2)-methylthiotransferase MiaB [Syntrophomonadaceae bacterium]|nr:tRNA (N6-isopentenyl adenosine(37)-C2)-methylthiotransferase MiaB [Syntrophomonadaceae bacterium]